MEKFPKRREIPVEHSRVLEKEMRAREMGLRVLEKEELYD